MQKFDIKHSVLYNHQDEEFMVRYNLMLMYIRYFINLIERKKWKKK